LGFLYLRCDSNVVILRYSEGSGTK
jgi:hypothetical protein